MALIWKFLGVRGALAVMFALAFAVACGTTWWAQNNLQIEKGKYNAEVDAHAKTTAQRDDALDANKQWQEATLLLSEDIVKLQRERDALAKANAKAVTSAAKAARLYVKPGAPSTTCAAALARLDAACPELKGY